MSRIGRYREQDGLARWQRTTDWPLTILALIFLVVLLVPMAFTLTPMESVEIDIANVVIWAVFVVDYLVRLYLAQERWSFVKTHPLALIVVAVPFLRPLRLLRLFAIVGVASRRAGRTLHGRATVYVVTVAIIVMVASSFVVLSAERNNPDANIQSIGDALWWSITTVTTVGYGDSFPVTLTGRITAVALMLTGIALLGVVTAAVAAWFVERSRKEDSGVVDAERETAAALSELRNEVRLLREELRSRPGLGLDPQD